MLKKQVKTSREHIQSLSKATPLQAVEELIWNGLDAGGPMVEVRLALGEMGSLQNIEIIDSGAGIPQDQLEQAFGEIGNSQKVRLKVNKDGRLFHGSEGKGRLKALALCRQPEWIITYRKNGELRRYSIKINRDDPDYFEVGEEETIGTGTTGTTVSLAYVDEQCASLLGGNARDILTRRFALYLSEYPGTSITYHGQVLKVDELIQVKADYPLPVEEGQPPATVTVIEWRFKLDSRKLYLCNESGFSFHDIPLRLHALGVDYTAYLRTPKVKEWADSGLLTTTEMDPSVQRVLDLAREQIRAHIRERLALTAQDVVTEWKQQEVYPYRDEEAKNPLVAAEQQVFDIVAVHVHELHPTFKVSDLDNKRLILTLIRKALESDPSALTSLLKSYVDLPEEEQKELADLLERTTLSSLIRAGKVVTERLDTLQAFEHILFNDDWKERLLERTQLHRLLAHELWVLDEEYLVATDDEGLHAVLKKHLHILGRPELAPDADVKMIDGKDGIPDLMLWHRRKVDRSLFEHLVVELKRPRDFLGQDEVAQIEKYAFTVIEDERFMTDKVQWKFVLLGNDLDSYARQRASSDSHPEGCIYRKGNVSIWVRRWADVLADARARYEFFRDKLNIEASSDVGLKTLKTKYAHLLAGRGVRKKKDLEIMAAKSASAEDGADPVNNDAPE
ncbi:MAG: ATP-binding protein [Planctomycetes bacterium]|nr:ATP-binding protein [Planctomycetota bacterium]